MGDLIWNSTISRLVYQAYHLDFETMLNFILNESAITFFA